MVIGMLATSAVAAGAADRHALYPGEGYEGYGDLEPVTPGKVITSAAAAGGYEEPNIFDVTAIQRHLAEMDILGDDVIQNADFDGDGEVTVFDVTNLQRYLAEMAYDGAVYTDDSYVSETTYDGVIVEEQYKERYEQRYPGKRRFERFDMDGAIEFDRVYAGRYLGEMSKNRVLVPIYENMQHTVALITSREQLYSLSGYMIEQFDDSFFDDNALVVWYDAQEDAQRYHDIDWIGVKDGTLTVVCANFEYWIDG